MIMDSPGVGSGRGGWGRRGSTCRFRGLASCRIPVPSGETADGRDDAGCLAGAGGRVPPSVAVLSAARLARRGGQRVRARVHRGGPAHRRGLPALRSQPRLRRHRVHGQAAAEGAARGGAGDAGADAVLRPAPVFLPPPDLHRLLLGARGAAGQPGRVAKLVAGRMPDPSSPVEALASFTLERDYGVHLGTVITLPMAGASQRQAVFNALNGGPRPKATGPRMAMRVVGIVAAENEFSAGQSPTYDLYPGPAFAVATKGSPAPPPTTRRLPTG